MQTMDRNTQDMVEGVMNLNNTVALGPNPVSALAAARDPWVTTIIPEELMAGNGLPSDRGLSYTENITTIGQGSTGCNDNYSPNQCLGFSLGYSQVYLKKKLEMVANHKCVFGAIVVFWTRARCQEYACWYSNSNGWQVWCWT